MAKILAIESSCDETAAAVVENSNTILSNIINSQANLHKKYGGVVPEVASRLHMEAITNVVDEALMSANLTLDEIDAVAVTYGPGLVGSLLVGVSFAKAISLSKNIPLIGVHHIEGHIAANYLDNIKPPFIALVVSGGHSHIILVKDYLDYKILGQTRDDAAGEAFDKVARVLGLSYPGGPSIDKASKNGDCDFIKFPKTKFKDSFDFSFSGIKTAVINYIHNQEQKNLEVSVPDIAASFQKAVVDILFENTIEAAKQNDISKIVLAGGVASNSLLRNKFIDNAEKFGYEFNCPPPIHCTDNAAMIGAAAYHYFINNKFSGGDLNAIANIPIDQKL